MNIAVSRRLSRLNLSLFWLLILVGAVGLMLARPAGLARAMGCAVTPGSGAYPTVQAAINDANCELITIPAGNLAGNLSITRSLILQGSGALTTFINGSGTNRVATINGSGIVVYLNNLRIVNGNASSASPSPNSGGGILVTGGATLHGYSLLIDNNLATVNTSGFGGGLAVVNNSSAYISSTLFYSNTASRRTNPLTAHGRGGGLYVNSSVLHLINSAVLNNLAAYRAGSDETASGGGLHANQNSVVYLSGNLWQNNIARGSSSEVCDLANCAGGLDDEGGGGVSVGFTTGATILTISHNIFSGNIANNVAAVSGNNSGRGGAISLQTTNTGGQITANLTAITATANIAALQTNGAGEEGRGGAIFARHANLSLQQAQLYDNQAAAAGNGSGGGIYIREPLASQSLLVTNSVLAGNTAAGAGEGAQLYIDYTNATANNLTRLVYMTLADDSLNPKAALFYESGDASDTLAITNTIVTSHAVGIQNVNVAGKATARYMLFFGNGDNHPSPGATAFPDTTGWVAGDPDPLFANPSANNYHLRAGSPASNAGIDAGVTTDLDGDARPQDGGFDIGADEFKLAQVYLPLIVKN